MIMAANNGRADPPRPLYVLQRLLVAVMGVQENQRRTDAPVAQKKCVFLRANQMEIGGVDQVAEEVGREFRVGLTIQSQGVPGIVVDGNQWDVWVLRQRQDPSGAAKECANFNNRTASRLSRKLHQQTRFRKGDLGLAG